MDAATGCKRRIYKQTINNHVDGDLVHGRVFHGLGIFLQLPYDDRGAELSRLQGQSMALRGENRSPDRGIQ